MQALNNFVVLEIVPEPEMSAGGIVLTRTENSVSHCKVKSIGPSVGFALGGEVGYAVDDTVLIRKNNGLKFKHNYVEYVMIPDTEILAKV